MTKLNQARAAVAAIALFATTVGPADATTYTYDDLGRVTSITYDDGKVVSYSYDPAGNRTQHVVTGSNSPPVANPDSAIVAPTVPQTINVTANDTDSDSDPLTVTSVATPTKGVASISSNNVIYTANAATTGTDTFNYTISDGQGGTASAAVTITINSLPVAVNDTATAFQGVAATINVIANDSDPDGDALTVVGTTTPGQGTASVSGNSVVYTPSGTATGTDTFTYTISDGRGGSASATVTVTIQASPGIVANNPALSTTSGTGISVAITTLATLNGNAATISSFTPDPACGSGTIATGGQSATFNDNLGYTFDARCEPEPPPQVCSVPYTVRKTSTGQDTPGTATVSVSARNIGGGGGVCP